jgi:hypothetical protein
MNLKKLPICFLLLLSLNVFSQEKDYVKKIKSQRRWDGLSAVSLKLTVKGEIEGKHAVHVKITHALGVVIYSETIFSEGKIPVEIHVNHLPPGLYFLRLQNGDYLEERRVVIK